MNRLLVNLLFLISLNLGAQTGGTYFVAVDGDDNNPGTFAQPFATWQVGIDATEAGDTLYIRGGVYMSYDVVKIDTAAYGGAKGHSGTANKPILIAGYPADIAADNWPILDCKYHCDSIDTPLTTTYNGAISFNKVEYITLKCLEVRNVFQCDSVLSGAINSISCANMTFERLRVHQVGTPRGFWVRSGAWGPSDSAYAVDHGGQTPSVASPVWPQPDTTRFINCDVWDLCDTMSSNPGNGGDGWRVDNYYGNYFSWDGCRVWNYSDDGIDAGEGTQVFNDTWVMSSNKYEVFGIEGNGFKAPAYDGHTYYQYSEADSIAKASDSLNRFTNCLGLFCPTVAFYHGVNSTRPSNPRYYNNTAYGCGTGFATENFGYDSIGSIYRNNISYGSSRVSPGYNCVYEVQITYVEYLESNNTWIHDADSCNDFYYNPAFTATEDNFVENDSTELVALFTAPRQSDGSLPVNRPAMLESTSDLIDGGLDIGLPYNGVAPDVGYYEFGTSTPITSSFELQDTADINTNVDVTYTGNASASATYYWNFGCATVISGSGQGPYTLEWPTAGCDTVSLYVEESNATSNTTADDIYINDGSILTSNFEIPEAAYVNTSVDVFYGGNASAAATYYWDFGSATILSGSGQGPYILEWTNGGWHAVSLYVEESGIVSDITTNDIHLLVNSITSSFSIQSDTLCPKSSTIITYTGNASDTATYYWNFGYATVLSGSGQGPYTVQWPYGGLAAVSLYVEEFNAGSDTTTNDVYVFFDPIFTINPYPNDTVSILDTIVLTGDIESVSYLWSSGETTQSIQVFHTPPDNGEVQSYWLMVTDDEGCTYTDTISVLFDLPVLINDFPNEIELKIYPNPVSDILNIELEIVEHGQYIFEVFDHLGRPVIRELRSFEPGIQKINLNMNSHSPGVYILSVKSNNGMIGVEKILK